MNDLDRKVEETLHEVASSFEPPPPSLIRAVHQRGRALRARAIASTLIVALLIASGAVFVARAISSNQSGSVIGPPSHDDPHKVIALAAMRHLTGLLNLPQGSMEVFSAPTKAIAAGPPQGSTGNFIDVTRYWIVPAPLEQTISWIQGHPPSGSSRLESLGTFSTRTEVVRDYAFGSQDDPQVYQGASLQLSIEALPGGRTAVRADGTAIWLTSTITKDRRVANPIRTTAAGGCPTSLGTSQDIFNPPADDLTKLLLPAEPPTAAIRCKYRNARVGRTRFQQHLIGLARLDASQAQRLARAIRTLPLGSSGPIISMGCPPPVINESQLLLTMRVEILVFEFPGRDDVDLWHGGFCMFYVDNGYITTVSSIGNL